MLRSLSFTATVIMALVTLTTPPDAAGEENWPQFRGPKSTGVVDGPNTGTLPGSPDSVLADQLGFGNIPRTIAVELTLRF